MSEKDPFKYEEGGGVRKISSSIYSTNMFTICGDQRDGGDPRRFRKARVMMEKVKKMKPQSAAFCRFFF